jgi:hypothetical protein
MSTFPLELIHAVVDNIVSTPELKTLRKVSKTFKTLATPSVFRVLHIRIHLDSIQRLENIHESDELRHFVEEVVFQYTDNESDDEDIESEGDSETRSVKVTAVEDLEVNDKWKGYEDEELWAYKAEQDEDEMRSCESTTEGSEDGNSDVKSTEGDEGGEFVEGISFAQMVGWPTPQGKPVFSFLSLTLVLNKITLHIPLDCENMQQRWPALFRLNKFTSLRTVRFSFHPIYTEMRLHGESYKPSTNFCIQKSVLASLASEPHPSTVKHLSLVNVIGADDGTYKTSSFQAIASSLQSLSILTISQDYDCGCDPELREWNKHFWFSTIPKQFLVPAQSSLMSLSLGSDEFVGPIDEFDINGHCFPHLRSLKLQHFVFGWHDVPAFIIKHKSTLRSLELHDNGMYLDLGSSDTNRSYWSDVWKQFQVELTNLKELVVRRSDYANSDCDSQPYVQLDGMWSFNTLDLMREQEEDAEALGKLQASMELRRPQQPRAFTFLDRWLIHGGKGKGTWRQINSKS